MDIAQSIIHNVIYCLIHKYLLKKHGKVYVGYVDLTKAFDLVNRGKLWKAVSDTGIKGKLCKSLLAMYKSVKACIRTSDGLTDFFNCPFGLKQECQASPILFSIFIPPTLKKWGAYCFRLVLASVRPCMLPSVQKFFKARVLKFHIWISHQKIAYPYFFSCPNYLPGPSYAPFKV